MDVVISPAYIEFSEEGAASEAIYSLGNEWGDVVVLLGPAVDRAVVLNWAELAILFLDEEEICGIGAPQFSDGSSF